VLLLSSGFDTSQLSNAPIPVDDILESGLGLSLDFDDLSRLGSRGALGSLNIREKAVFVDESLDPCAYPRNRGRFNFTVAHEVAHWRLHHERAPKSGSVATMVETKPFVCVGQENQDVEWEANYFASCMLMPRLMVEAAWVKAGGRLDKPLVFDPVRHSHFVRRRRRGFVHIGAVVDELMETPERYLFDRVAGQIAPTFDVSIEAMRIRLQTLRLMVGKKYDPEGQFIRFFAKVFDVPHLKVLSE